MDALIATGDLGAARVALAQARASVSATATPKLDIAEARLASVDGDYEKVIPITDKVMKTLKAKREAAVAKAKKAGTKPPSAATVRTTTTPPS